MAEKSDKTVKIRFRSATPGLAYAQGKWYEVSEEEFKKLKSYRITPQSVLRTGNEKKISAASTPLTIETWEEINGK